MKYEWHWHSNYIESLVAALHSGLFSAKENLTFTVNVLNLLNSIVAALALS